jgi:cold shock CspA family protein
VSKILPDKGYGFLTSEDGRGVYFHKNSVLHGAFSRLKVGTTVSFHEEPGDKGPQATTLRVLRMVRSPVSAKRTTTIPDLEIGPS